MTARDQFLQTLKNKYPGIKNPDEHIAANLICPSVVELPLGVLKQAQDFAKSLFSLRNNSLYVDSMNSHVDPNLQQMQIQPAGNYSICMSYDFHLDQNGVLQLIEVNTNAAFLALGDLLYESWSLPKPVLGFSMDEFLKNIQQEYHLSLGGSGPQRVAIVDENPHTQRLFIEFLVYREYLHSKNIEVEILDYREELANFDFIYNRGTDFYWQDTSWQNLRSLFNEKKTCVSPNPVEYFYLADKARMVDWSNSERLTSWGVSDLEKEVLLRHVPLAKTLTPENAEEIWAERKKFFLKPQQSFGSKQSYKGGSVSRRVFDEIKGQKFLAQSLVPAPELTLETTEGPQSFKYDLRFFAYRDRIQSVIARVYQGQVTNLQSPYGGFAPIRWKS